MNKNNIKNKMLINVFITILIVGLIYFFIYPLYTGVGTIYNPKNNVSKLLEEKTKLDGALNIAKDYSLKINSINKDFITNVNTLPVDKLEKILPSSIDRIIIAYEFTRLVEKEASKMLFSDLKIGEIDNSNSNNDKGYKVLTLSFSLTGSYENMKSFLQSLEKSERIYNITSLSFASEKEGGVIFKYSFNVETYYTDSVKEADIINQN